MSNNELKPLESLSDSYKRITEAHPTWDGEAVWRTQITEAMGQLIEHVQELEDIEDRRTRDKFAEQDQAAPTDLTARVKKIEELLANEPSREQTKESNGKTK